MTALPAFVVAVLCGWFTYLVSRQYAYDHKLNNLFWSVSLAMSALASLSYALTSWTQPHNAFLFSVYYLFGAMWMPSIMGLGSLALVFKKGVVLILSWIVIGLGLVGTIFLFLAPVSVSALAELDGGAGVGIMGTGLWLPFLIVLNSFGAIAVIVVALMSAWRTLKKKSTSRFLYGNLWLASGILIISMAGTTSRLGFHGLFWPVMLVGWLITFVGYRILTPSSQVVAKVVHG